MNPAAVARDLDAVGLVILDAFPFEFVVGALHERVNPVRLDRDIVLYHREARQRRGQLRTPLPRPRQVFEYESDCRGAVVRHLHARDDDAPAALAADYGAALDHRLRDVSLSDRRANHAPAGAGGGYVNGARPLG